MPNIFYVFLNSNEHNELDKLVYKTQNVFLKILLNCLEPSQGLWHGELTEHLFCFALLEVKRFNRGLYNRLLEIGKLQDLDIENCMRMHEQDLAIYKRSME